MGKRGGGKLGRRTVIQLEGDGKKSTAYGLGYKGGGDKAGASVLGGLIGQYGDSDDSQSDSEGQRDTMLEKGKMQAFVPSSEPPTGSSAPVAKQPDPSVNGVPADEGPVSNGTTPTDVDAKLQDFLAEIDALGSEKAANGNAPDAASTSAGQPSQDEWETDTSAEETENSEPPPTRPSEPTTSWQHCLDESTQYYYYWNVTSNEVTWEIPDGYSQYLLQYKEYESRLAKFEKDLKEWQERQQQKPAARKRKRRKKVQPVAPAVPEPAPPPPDQCPGELESTPRAEEEIVDSKTKVEEGNTLKKKDKGKHKHKAKETRAGAESDVPDPGLVHGPELPPPPPKPIIGPVLPSNADSEPMETNESEGGAEEAVKEEETTKESDNQEEEVDDDFIYRQLEEPVFECYTYVNKKYEAKQDLGDVSGADSTLDIDIDIDSELESALALQQLQRHEEEEEKMSKNGVKRCLPAHADGLPLPKKQKQELHEDSFIDKNCLKDKVSLLAEAAELSQLVSDKLEFLEVNRQGLSKLQVLLIEMQTRIGDWKCGGLSTDYLLKQLRAADLDLECYEASAAPRGWACRWDRNYKRYYYSHVVSGLCQWEYPEPDHTVDQSQERCVEMQPSEAVVQIVEPAGEQSELPAECKASAEKSAEDKAEEKLPVDFSSLAGAPPPPPPPSDDAAPERVPESDAPPTQPAGGHGQPLVSYPDAPAPVGGIDSYPDSVEGHAESDAVTSEGSAALRLPERSVNQPKMHVSHAEEPPPPGTETEPLPDPSLGNRLSSLINYDASDSDSDSSKSDSNRSARSRRSSSSSSSYRSRGAARHSDSSDSEHEPTEGSKAPHQSSTDCVNAAEIPQVDLNGRHLEVENSMMEISTDSATGSQLNVISKPAHFAAAPVLLKPQAPSTHPDTGADSMTNQQQPTAAPSVADSVVEEKGKTPSKEASKEKKKKKDKSLSGGGLAMKRKGVNSMVQKWQKVQKEVEKDKKQSKLPPPPDA